MLQQELEIINKLGLHARASAKLTQTASQYQSQIWLSRNGKRVNAKSIMGVMMLAASKGSRIGVDIEGEDEERAMTAIADLINGKFGEGE